MCDASVVTARNMQWCLPQSTPWSTQDIFQKTAAQQKRRSADTTLCFMVFHLCSASWTWFSTHVCGASYVVEIFRIPAKLHVFSGRLDRLRPAVLDSLALPKMRTSEHIASPVGCFGRHQQTHLVEKAIMLFIGKMFEDINSEIHVIMGGHARRFAWETVRLHCREISVVVFSSWCQRCNLTNRNVLIIGGRLAF